MDVTAVDSTALATVAYNPSRRILQLEFRSRAIYQYFDVPDTVHQALLHARSKGEYFNQNIRMCFPYRRRTIVAAAPAAERSASGGR